MAQPSEDEYLRSFDYGESGDQSTPAIVFALFDREYAIEIASAEEVAKPRAVATLPHMPGFVRGVVSMRGEMVVLIDLKMRLGLANAPTPYERIIIVERGSGDLKAGLAVDRLCGIVGLSAEMMVETMAGGEPCRNFSKGVYKAGDRTLVLLDAQRLLDFAPV
jgi:purine-binding chemotaxis protein CheW